MIHRLILMLLLIVLMAGCHQKEAFQTAGELHDYQPIQIGSNITYRLDSTIYTSNQTLKTTRSRVVRFHTDAMVTDGAGRTSYRIIRSIRDALDTNRWIPDQACLLILGDGTLEWVELNQRFVLMATPIRENFNWKGNRFINTISDPQRQYLDGWDYTWKSVGLPFTSGNRLFQNTATVDQRNDSINDGRDKSRFFSRDIARDVYAFGIGLVFRERLHEVWQPANASSATGYYEAGSYGIRMTYLSHKFLP
ncbi:MAG: hypothetical protein RL151_1732 [Bacteroidota bacterium]